MANQSPKPDRNRRKASPPSAQVTMMKPDVGATVAPEAGPAPGRAPAPAGGHPQPRGFALGSMLGKYRLVAVLGRGGMGTVYSAEDPLIKRRVAIKVLPHELARDPALIERLLGEARAAGALNHPNVVTIHDVDQQHGFYYIVMELVGGGSVEEYLHRKGSPGWRAATRLVGEACKALGAAHERGLVHRDIKPANLMLTGEGHVKVSDFGLAKIESADAAHNTTPGAILGTPAYMSPEQCRGEKVDHRTDLYSLGATYYAMLTGRPPYEAASSIQVMFAHCSSPIPDPRDLKDDVPEGCVEVLKKCLAKDPNDRYESAKEMLADLRGILGGATIGHANPMMELAAGGHAQAIEYAPPPSRKQLPVGWIVAGTLGAVAVAIIVSAAFRVRQVNQKLAVAVAPTASAQPTAPQPALRVVRSAVDSSPDNVPDSPSVGPEEASTLMPTKPTTVAEIEDVFGASAGSKPSLILPKTPPVDAAKVETPPPVGSELTPSHPTGAPSTPAPAPLPPDMENSIRQHFVLIAPGSFTMGDAKLANASPPHEVKITKAFYLGKFEVNEREMAEIMGRPAMGREQRDELPAAFVTWAQASEFCRRLSERAEEKTAGRSYRLPTEAEWEYACRAGTVTRFGIGDDTLKTDQANFGKKIDLSTLLRREPPKRPTANRPRPGEGGPRGPRGEGSPERPGQRPPQESEPASGGPSNDDSGGNTEQRMPRLLEPVGSFPPNAWGLHDMHGNVWEWVSDFYAPDAYKTAAATDPIGPATGRTHVARGGCWSSTEAQCASAFRNGQLEVSMKEPGAGFRVVCEVKR